MVMVMVIDRYTSVFYLRQYMYAQKKQVEYATKAVENSGTALGVRCKDGVLLAVEKLLISKMIVAGSNRWVEIVGCGCAAAVSIYISTAVHAYYGKVKSVHRTSKRLLLQQDTEVRFFSK